MNILPLYLFLLRWAIALILATLISMPTPSISISISSSPYPPYPNQTTNTSASMSWTWTWTWTTVPIAQLTGDPFCLNHADPDNNVGNHCVCKNGVTIGIIPYNTTRGNISDYQPCAYTMVVVGAGTGAGLPSSSASIVGNVTGSEFSTGGMVMSTAGTTGWGLV